MHIKLIIGYLDTIPVELLLDRFVKVKVYRPVVLSLYPRITGYSYSALSKFGYPDFRLRLFKYKLVSVCDAFEYLHRLSKIGVVRNRIYHVHTPYSKRCIVGDLL